MRDERNLILEPNAVLIGRCYREDKPWSCRYCYWWEGLKKGCDRAQCYYLLPEREPVKPEPRGFGNCSCCAYGRVQPCVGFCMARIECMMKERWKMAKEHPVLMAYSRLLPV